ncbi:acylneuraminate cytidylyltransferase family protein [Suttonella sp. R2A3]|uniref:acylneuraminate cytidylyltransferase family protein n=1 Tax=Suttonella sp. R2A3 TaxID=2908648 RepID=UPI001F308078|nr:acylneuraminate cytidylyltransferase family protein [Suttonella sp. R2A3]
MLRKNILPLAGKPLVAWTIEAALESKHISKVVVTSDNAEVLDIAKTYLVTALQRPDHLATDTATSFDAVKHAIDNNQGYEYVVMLQPTSPLRNAKHIDEAIELLESKNSDAVISVCETEHSPLWTNTLPASFSMDNFLRDEVYSQRSQDLPVYYRLNGALYICRISSLLKQKSFFIKNNIFAYKMDMHSSVDIDTEMDFKWVEFLFNDIRG